MDTIMEKTGTLSRVVLALGFLAFTVVQAQNILPPEVARYGTPDQIVVNGKIVSMDDPGLNTNPGRVYEAMALKGNRIMALGTPPDVMAKLKEYGIIVSANPPRLRRESVYLEDYGPAVEPFLQPVKTWLDQGINVVGQFEGYEGIGTNFNIFITREVNGRTVLPEEKLDRVTVLKMWTKWASRYLLKEKEIGTLEVGKLADLVVLDKDFFTVPTEQIPKIIPQMTLVGGEIRYLGSELASKLGMEPVGYEFAEGHQPWER